MDTSGDAEAAGSCADDDYIVDCGIGGCAHLGRLVM